MTFSRFPVRLDEPLYQQSPQQQCPSSNLPANFSNSLPCQSALFLKISNSQFDISRSSTRARIIFKSVIRNLKSEDPISTSPALQCHCPNLISEMSNLKSQISNLKFPVRPRPEDLASAFPLLHRSIFARAPMILPGTPFGRPCALAKTPARTRKHCVFSLSPLPARESDNVHFQLAFSLRFDHQPLLP